MTLKHPQINKVMKKNKALKISIILFIMSICTILISKINAPKQELLFYNNIEALATGEDTNPACTPGGGFCSYHHQVYAGYPSY